MKCIYFHNLLYSYTARKRYMQMEVYARMCICKTGKLKRKMLDWIRNLTDFLDSAFSGPRACYESYCVIKKQLSAFNSCFTSKPVSTSEENLLEVSSNFSSTN